MRYIRRKSMTFETDRLILRPWVEEDAEDLYEVAKHPDVGPIAGWPEHRSVGNSREVIREILSTEGTYAVVLKSNNKPVGSVGLTFGEASTLNLPDKEAEIGYWIGVPYWGQGLIPEAVNAMIYYGFEMLELEKIWCGYFDGNIKSKRVQEKCGFKYHHTKENFYWPLMDDIRTEHVTCLTRDEWLEEQ